MMGARDFASIHLSDNHDYVNYFDVETRAITSIKYRKHLI